MGVCTSSRFMLFDQHDYNVTWYSIRDFAERALRNDYPDGYIVEYKPVRKISINQSPLIEETIS